MRAASAILPILFALVPAGRTGAAGGTNDLAEIRRVLRDESAERAVRLLNGLHGAGNATAESHYLLGLALQVRLDEVGILSRRGVASRLRETLERAIELDPEYVGAHEELADFYFFAPGFVGGSHKKAEAQISRIEAFSPFDASRVRGRHAYDDGEHREAEAHLTRAIELDEGVAQVWYLRGLARVRLLEKDAAALADFDRALELGWQDPILHYQIGRLCVRLTSCPARGEAALRLFISESEGRNRAFGHYRLAQLLEQGERLLEARDAASSAVRLEPELEDAQALLERVKAKLGATAE